MSESNIELRLKEKVGLSIHDITGSIVLHSTINQSSWAITTLSSKGQDWFEHIPQNTRKLEWSVKNHKETVIMQRFSHSRISKRHPLHQKCSRLLYYQKIPGVSGNIASSSFPGSTNIKRKQQTKRKGQSMRKTVEVEI